MSAKLFSDDTTYAFAKRFMTAIFALRSHIAARSILHYSPGLSPNQLKLLHLIFHSPGISQRGAAERLGVTTASISTAVREMEVQGLIERCPDPNDARVMLLRLAPFGERIFDQVFDSFINTCADLLDALPAEDQQELVERLENALIVNNINLDSGKLSYADRVQMAKEHPGPTSC